jgi:hypothetical protein
MRHRVISQPIASSIDPSFFDSVKNLRSWKMDGSILMCDTFPPLRYSFLS